MVVSLLKANALKAKYLTKQAYQNTLSKNLTAVVCSPTSGIGQACAIRLAEQGYSVIAIGRDKPGRAEAVKEQLTKASKTALDGIRSGEEDGNVVGFPTHEFYPCDAFSLSSIKHTTETILEKHPVIDVLVMTQGMATTQGFTPTLEGNDEKMTLHYYSRMAMIQGLLPGLRKSQNTPVVLSVLSGGVHSEYKYYREDTALKKHYSIANAANAAGFYNDLCLDHYALDSRNSNISFIHSSPGFVNTNWGTEFGVVLRSMVRVLQPLGRKASDCAEYLLGPTVFELSNGGHLLKAKDEGGVYIYGENGQAKGLTKEHGKESREFIWAHTKQIMEKVGFIVDE
jgi:NAD(P)-dependent dehydrogenase (short-subunit alcohol dehydrogenase family)